MKLIPCKDGIIYHYVKKYRRRRLITVLILAVLLFAYAFSVRPYLANAFLGPEVLDAERFASEADMREVGEPFELHRSESTAIESYALKAYSYWQDMDYEFNVTLSAPERTDIIYTTANTDSTAADADMESAVIYTASIGGVKTLVLAYPHQELKDGDVVCGVFTAPARIIEHDIAKSDAFEADEMICEFMLDIRGISMESQFADITICIMLLMLILYLTVRLIFQYINPFTSPTYRGIDKYGDLAETVVKIEKQLCKAVDGKNIKEQIITENWIVSRDTFKLKIVKNHMQKH